MLAQKQPHIQRVRNSSLVERLCAEDVTGLNTPPKLRVRLYEYCTRVGRTQRVTSPGFRPYETDKGNPADGTQGLNTGEWYSYRRAVEEHSALAEA